MLGVREEKDALGREWREEVLGLIDDLGGSIIGDLKVLEGFL